MCDCRKNAEAHHIKSSRQQEIIPLKAGLYLPASRGSVAEKWALAGKNAHYYFSSGRNCVKRSSEKRSGETQFVANWKELNVTIYRKCH